MAAASWWRRSTAAVPVRFRNGRRARQGADKEVLGGPGRRWAGAASVLTWPGPWCVWPVPV